MKRKEIKENIISTIGYFTFIFVITFLIVTYIGQRTCVEGNSMNDYLQDGDNLILDKITYRVTDPERFDIVVFPHLEFFEKKFYIKRIIGLPGETVFIDNVGSIFIDDKLLEETYGKETIVTAGIAATPIILGENEYFLLGDNRNNSSDSRDPSVGTIKRKEIVGKVFCRVYPFSKIGFIS